MRVFIKAVLLQFICLIVASSFAIAQAPAIQWQKSFGGSAYDYAYDIELTNDGGYIAVGNTTSSDGDVSTNKGSTDIWVVKLDGSGSMQWQKSLGGSKAEYGYAVVQTSDGGYIIAGETFSKDGDVIGIHGNSNVRDMWVVKLNTAGTMEWQKCLGGDGLETAYDIQQTSDGGYIVVGNSAFVSGDITMNNGGTDVWAVKLDSTGSIQWQKSFGGSKTEYGHSVRQTSDGGYIVAGESSSDDGDVTGSHGSIDYWIIKLDNSGTLQWQKALGGSKTDIAYSIQETTDGGYIVAGETYSNDGDVTGNGANFNNYWIVKLNSTGNIDWEKKLANTKVAQSVRQTSDSGYIVAGFGSNNANDYWIVKLNASGAVEWEKPIGGFFDDRAYAIRQTADGGYIVAGEGHDDGVSIADHHGDRDMWIVKLGSATSVPTLSRYSLTISPNPSRGIFTVSGTTGAGKDITLQLTNILGQVVYETTIGIQGNSFSKTINPGNKLAPGLYTVLLKSDNNCQTLKLVVEK